MGDWKGPSGISEEEGGNRSDLLPDRFWGDLVRDNSLPGGVGSCDVTVYVRKSIL